MTAAHGAGSPAGTGTLHAASGVWAAKRRDGGPRLDCRQPGGQPQGVSTECRAMRIVAIRGDARQMFKTKAEQVCGS